mmetsp:Transcript_21923/g.46278  ORF Transcript_21923/g.46278 Transcript_21923/m.46278 type:complete len:276 (+) Transcript_21923:393-1220(+)
MLAEGGRDTVDEAFVSRCTLPMFGELNCDQLDSFIMAHQDKENPEFKAKSKIPHDLSAVVHDDDDDAVDITVYVLGKETNVMPSELLKNNEWVGRICDLFDLEKLGLSRDAYVNFAVTSAYMVIAKHVKMDIRSLSDNDSLLASIHSNMYLPVASFPSRWGAYLHNDNNREAFVRAGKKTGEGGFAKRGQEHLAEAKKSKAGSDFYFMYPSRGSTRAAKRGTRGLFENLSHVIAAGFDPSADQFELAYDLALSPEMNVSQNPGFESVLGVYDGSS